MPCGVSLGEFFRKQVNEMNQFRGCRPIPAGLFPPTRPAARLEACPPQRPHEYFISARSRVFTPSG